MEKMKSGDSVTINVPSHGCEVVRIARANRKKSQILWTNGHFSMGGREVISWEEDGTGLALSILWPWREPLEMLIKSPEGKTFSGQTEGVSLEEDGRRARIRIKWALDNPIHIGIGIS